MIQKTLERYTKLPQQQSIEKKKSETSLNNDICARAVRSRLPPSPHVWQRGARCCTGAEWWHVQPGSLARTHGAYAAPRTRVLSHGPTHVHARTRSEKTFSFTRPHGAWSVLEIPANVTYSLGKRIGIPEDFYLKSEFEWKGFFFFFKSEISRLTQDTLTEIRASSARSQWAAGP